jgi:hypothetical protein
MAATETPASGANVATVRTSPLDANISAGPAAKIGMGIFGLVLLVGIIYIPDLQLRIIHYSFPELA